MESRSFGFWVRLVGVIATVTTIELLAWYLWHRSTNGQDWTDVSVICYSQNFIDTCTDSGASSLHWWSFYRLELSEIVLYHIYAMFVMLVVGVVLVVAYIVWGFITEGVSFFEEDDKPVVGKPALPVVCTCCPLHSGVQTGHVNAEHQVVYEAIPPR